MDIYIVTTVQTVDLANEYGFKDVDDTLPTDYRLGFEKLIINILIYHFFFVISKSIFVNYPADQLIYENLNNKT